MSIDLFFRSKCHRTVTTLLVTAAFTATAGAARAAEPAEKTGDAGVGTTRAAPAESPNQEHGPRSSRFPSHRFKLAAHDLKRPEIGVNFGLFQLALGGFNVAGEFRYRRFWFEYSHGQSLELNKQAFTLTKAERDADLTVDVPYTTGFGVGATVIDELWLGLEFKAHRFDVSTPVGASTSYHTYSVGPVLGYKFFIWRGLHANVYARYWPNVASTLSDGKVTLDGAAGPVVHEAHGFDLFANVSLGWAFGT
jgi:hypothetical protein